MQTTIIESLWRCNFANGLPMSVHGAHFREWESGRGVITEPANTPLRSRRVWILARGHLFDRRRLGFCERYSVVVISFTPWCSKPDPDWTGRSVISILVLGSNIVQSRDVSLKGCSDLVFVDFGFWTLDGICCEGNRRAFGVGTVLSQICFSDLLSISSIIIMVNIPLFFR